jgi:transcriptional regulator with XRE-family HTH domain
MMIHEFSPRQSRAARALLGWSQQDLAKNAGVGVSTVADFERVQRTPTNDNADAMRTALEKAGITFRRDSVKIGAFPGLRGHAAPGGIPLRYIDVTDLDHWAARRDGQGSIPELLSKLIRAGYGADAELRFPSDEAVQLSGWDGISTVAAGNEYVPAGTTGWEIGTQRNGLKSKADEEYERRTDNSLGLDRANSTFMFVTPRSWTTTKEKWLKERRADGKWKDVRALEGTDLVHWIEQYPAVGQWLAITIGKRPPGLRQLSEAWDEWSLSTQFPLSTDLILTGRDNEAARILSWLRGGGGLISVQGESPNEAIAFLYAAIQELPQEYAAHYDARCLVADTTEAARALGDSSSPMIIVLEGGETGLAARLAQRGHYIYLAYGSDIGTPADVVRLERPARLQVEYALTAMGFDEVKARNLAQDSARSLAVLRRLTALAPETNANWGGGEPPRGMIAALLAGAWDESSEGDRSIIAKIAGVKYETAVATLPSVISRLDGIVRKAGDIWKIASPRDAWFQLAHHISASDFSTFEAAILEVLATPDPRFDIEPDERWLASTKGVHPTYSGALREGLCETLILFSLFGTQVRTVSNPDARVDHIVRRLLENADEKRWWTLSRDYQRLAEAAPQVFLDVIETHLDAPQPSLSILFQEEGGMFGGEHLSSLLWALESLAWDQRLLGQVTTILAKLDALDPGDGRWAKRPKKSLRQIFLLWMPQTNAPLMSRLRVLDRLLKNSDQRLSDVGWRLMLSIFPQSYDTSDNSPHPRWRDFSERETEQVTDALIWQGAEELSNRILAHVGQDRRRWSQLIDILANFAPPRRSEIIAQFVAAATGINEPNEWTLLWGQLRDLIHRHRELSDAAWAMQPSEVDELEKIYHLLEPSDPIIKIAWLFDGSVNLPKPTHKDPKDNDNFRQAWDADEKEAARQRIEAVQAIVAQYGPAGIFQLGQAVQLPYLVGLAVAQLPGSDALKHKVIEQALTGADRVEWIIGDAIVRAIHETQGDGWASSLLAEAAAKGWSNDAIVRLLHALPAKGWIWQMVADAGQEIEYLYWKTFKAPFVHDEDSDLLAAIDKLIAAGRASHAVKLVGRSLGKDVPHEVLARILAASTKESWTETDISNDIQMFRHYVTEILKRLDQDGDKYESEIATAEWAFLPMFRFSGRPTRVLHKQLSTYPAFFVEVLSALYKPSKDSGIEEPPPTDIERAKAIASQAYNLLRTWRRVPGLRDDHTIDETALEAWIGEARSLCAKVGRTAIGDQQIGQMLSGCPADPDGAWPIIAVREVIENTRSRELERGFLIGLLNGRGVTSRWMTDGGEQEREMVARYRGYAEAVAFEWHRTAAVLNQIAKDYEAQARRLDDDAERNDW